MSEVITNNSPEYIHEINTDNNRYVLLATAAVLSSSNVESALAYYIDNNGQFGYINPASSANRVLIGTQDSQNNLSAPIWYLGLTLSGDTNAWTATFSGSVSAVNLSVSSTTTATTSSGAISTGALKVNGGVGIQENLIVLDETNLYDILTVYKDIILDYIPLSGTTTSWKLFNTNNIFTLLDNLETPTQKIIGKSGMNAGWQINTRLYINDAIPTIGEPVLYNFYVNGNSYLNGNVILNPINSGYNTHILSTQGATVIEDNNNISLTGALIVDGGTVILEKLIVLDDSELYGDVTLNTALTNTYIKSEVGVTMTTIDNINTISSGALIVSGGVGIEEKLIVLDNTELYESLYIKGTGIYYMGTLLTSCMIEFLDNTTDQTGNGISIGGGGLTILGSGESMTTMKNNLGYTAGSELTIIASDNNIRFFPNQQTYDASAEITMTASRIWAGVNDNTTREALIGVLSGAGQIYLFSEAAAANNRGLYVTAHGTGSAKAVISVDTNNNVTFNGTATAANNAISTVTRSGTTFTATRINGTTFTFDLQDNNTTYSLSTLGAAAASEAIKSIARSGVNFTATRCNGTTFTFNQLDNNNTYSLSSLGAAAASEAIKTIARSGVNFTATRCNNTTFTFTQLDNNNTYSLSSLGAAAASEAIKNIARSGVNFTATRCNGTTFTFNQLDNNNTYSLSSLGAAAASHTHSYAPTTAITAISRSGTTFTAGRSNGTSFTFNLQDNNTNTWRKFKTTTYTYGYTCAANNTVSISGTNFKVSTPSGYTPVAFTRADTGKSQVVIWWMYASATGSTSVLRLRNTTSSSVSDTATVTILYLESANN